MISATSTEPTAHSPPKPNPCIARVKSSWPNECVKPLRKVNTANHSTVSCKMRARPYRSASAPAAQPPSAEVISVAGNVARLGGAHAPQGEQRGDHEAIDHEIEAIEPVAQVRRQQRAPLIRSRRVQPH